ncbi:MAG: DUF2188 domain-containing protein [Patescibacteria group bacterium]|nr:DUF2188 domain-containing protein [Patescibacteria group bacterium]
MKYKLIPLRPPNPNNPKIKAYIEAMEKGDRSSHVMPHEEGWIVRKYDTAEGGKIFKTQQQAIEYGRKLAIKAKANLFIHRKDRSIRQRWSY